MSDDKKHWLKKHNRSAFYEEIEDESSHIEEHQRGEDAYYGRGY